LVQDVPKSEATQQEDYDGIWTEVLADSKTTYVPCSTSFPATTRLVHINDFLNTRQKLLQDLDSIEVKAAAAKIPTTEVIKQCFVLRKKIRADIIVEQAAKDAEDKPDTCTDDTDTSPEELLSNVFESFHRSDMPIEMAKKYIRKIASSIGCSQQSLQKLEEFYFTPGVFQFEESENGEMDTQMGAIKRPLSPPLSVAASESGSGDVEHSNADDLEWCERFKSPTNFPAEGLEEDEVPCMQPASTISSEDFEMAEETPCLSRRLFSKTVDTSNKKKKCA